MNTEQVMGHPAYQQSPVLGSQSLLRRAPGAPSWSPDGEQIAFYWAPVDTDALQVYVWTPNDGGVRALTEAPFRASAAERSLIDRLFTDRPRWSPQGDALAVAGTEKPGQGPHIWLIDPRDASRRRLSAGPGQHRSPRWSPDGRRIAFVSYRDGLDSLWVIDRDGGPALQVVWDRHHNSDPQWSPDGRYLAFTTQRSPVNSLVTQVAMVDLETGHVEVLTEGDRIHSRYPRWSPDGTWLYFLSDRSGYDEIWRFHLATGRQEQVTLPTGQDKEGEFALSPDGGRVAYSRVRRTCHDLEVVAVERTDTGDAPVRLNDNDGICHYPAWSPDGKRLAYLGSGPTFPPEIFVVEAESRREVARTRCSPEPDVTMAVEMVDFPTFDGRRIDALLYHDPSRSGPRPAVLFIHGGPNAQFTNGWYPFLHRLAAEGYVILAPNSRGSTGYGRAFMDLNIKDWGGGDYQDWLAAVDFLVSAGWADRNRVAIWGRSYGGYATLTGLSKAPGVFKCGVCHFGPSDLIRFYEETSVRWLMVHFLGLPAFNLDIYREQSPIGRVDHIRGPLLVLQGEKDDGVPPSQSEYIVEELRKRGRNVEYVCYPGEGHGFDRPEHMRDAADRIRRFFAEHLR